MLTLSDPQFPCLQMGTIIFYVIPPPGEAHSWPSDPSLRWLLRPRLSSHLSPLSSVWLPAHPTVSSLRTLLLPETFLCPQSLESTGLGVWCPTGAQNTFTILWVMIRWGTQSSAAVDTCQFVCCKQHTRKKWLEQTSWLGFHRPRAVSVFYSRLVQNLIVPE